MVTYKELETIKCLLKGTDPLALPYYVFSSEEEHQKILRELEYRGLVKDGQVTELGLSDIEPCRVKNAIILAAGGSDISAKSVYSLPKGLYVKDGETLIERQIRQLKEAGIEDITVVVGYKQEMYFFLMEKWGVDLRINPAPTKGNILSLNAVIDKMDQTYICNCDNYFVENPFSAYEHGPFHATVMKTDASRELSVKTNHGGRILEVTACAGEAECLYGHTFVDSCFSRRFKTFLAQELPVFRTDSLFWEEFFSRHAQDLDLFARNFNSEFIYEFDSIQEIQNIDGLFLDNVSKRVNDRICSVFGCSEDEICDIEILSKGLTNILFTFVVRGKKYIFRYPCDSSQTFIYRDRECRAQKLAHKAGADTTYIYIDEEGCKISEFRENCKDLSDVYYKDLDFMCELSRKIRAMHDEGLDMPDWQDFYNNPIEAADALMTLASNMKGDLFERFSDDHEKIVRLFEYTERDGIKKTMCHNDINGDNCLVTEDTFDVIDWEFAGFNDPAYDFGRVIAMYDFDSPDVDAILEAYFGRPATPLEHLHWIAYVGIHNWYYVNWALYKESINESSRDWMLFFYKVVKRVFAYALPKYEEIYD